jgi:hypothetical protein
LISLTTSVGNAIQRTKRELQRTRLWHAFYAFALPMYTLTGALLFQVSLKEKALFDPLDRLWTGHMTTT